MRILIIFLSGVGNSIIFLPIIEALKNNLKDVEIDIIVGNKAVHDIFQTFANINSIYIYSHAYPKRSNLLSKTLSRINLFWKLKNKKYNYFLSTSLSSVKEGLFGLLLGSKSRIGFGQTKLNSLIYTNLIEINSSQHEFDLRKNILPIFKINKFPDIPTIDVPKKLDGYATSILKKTSGHIVIGIHPGSHETLTHKRWPIQNFGLLLQNLDSVYKCKFLFLGSATEIDLGEKLGQLVPESNCMNLIGKTSIIETTALIKQCDFFISNDTALMHIASAVGTQGLAIFGPSSIIKNHPLNNNIQMLYNSDCDTQLNQMCNDCNKKFIHDKTPPSCLTNITVNTVTAETKKSLSSLIENTNT